MSTAKSSSRNILARVSPGQWAALILTILLVVFVLQNRAKTSITLFWMNLSAPLWFTLLAVFVVGWVVGVLTNRRGKA
ncbi:hypothetical protein [Rhodococcus sp. NPDC058521]|uniref:hypothetical protein n=1 Tax=Rhodococcus sp. NPDC058521 TaxID=3346536 RepID=UPI00365B6EC3